MFGPIAMVSCWLANIAMVSCAGMPLGKRMESCWECFWRANGLLISHGKSLGNARLSHAGSAYGKFLKMRFDARLSHGGVPLEMRFYALKNALESANAWLMWRECGS